MYIKELVIDENNKFVVFGSSHGGYYSSATLYLTDKVGLLVDTLFRNSETQKIIDYVKKNNISIETIIISHYEPEYYFGMELLKSYKSDIKVLASKKVVAMIAKHANENLIRWGKKMSVPANVILPHEIKGVFFMWNDMTINIIGKNKSRTILYFESHKVVVGGPNLFENVHPYLGDVKEKKDRLSWINSLLKIKQLDVIHAIPSHFHSDIKLDSSCIDMTLKYLFLVERMIEFSDCSKTLYESLVKQYPYFEGLNLLELGCEKVKSKEE